MTEHQLRSELRRVAGSVPVPPDLYPADVLRWVRRGALRRRRLASVALAVVMAVLAVALSPAGLEAGKQAATWVANQGVRFFPVAVRPAPAGSTALRVVPVRQAGEAWVRVVPAPWAAGVRSDEVRVMTVAALRAAEGAWPLPSYRGPAGGDLAVLHTRPLPGGGSETVLHLSYVAGHAPIELRLTRCSGCPATPSEPAGGDREGLRRPRQETLVVHGQAVGVHEANEGWLAAWSHEAGSGWVRAELALEELVRILESMPGLR